MDHPFSENETQNMEPHDRTVLTAHLQDELTKGSQALHDLLRNQKLDLLQVCAPWDSPLSSTIRSMGGRAYSIGNHNGCDLRTMKMAVWLMRLMVHLVMRGGTSFESTELVTRRHEDHASNVWATFCSTWVQTWFGL